MNQPTPSTRQSYYDIALFGLLFTVFFWLLTRFIEALYTLGLLGVEIPPEIASVVFLLSPLVLVAFPNLLAGRSARRLALACAVGVLLCQGISPLLATRVRMLVTGLGTGLFLLGLPALLMARFKDTRPHGTLLGGALALAGVFSVALRSRDSGNGPLSGPLPLLINTLVVAAALALLFWFPRASESAEGGPAASPKRGGFWRTVGLYAGMFSALVLLYYGFLAPNVIARWTGGDYAWIYTLALGALALFSGLYLGWPRLRALLTPRVLLVWSVLFVLVLALALLPFAILFPSDPAAYPLDAPVPGWPAYAMLDLALALHPVIYAAFARLAGTLLEEHPTPRHLAGASALAAVFLLVMIFAQVLTTVYDYMPVVGPLFRDRFWQVIYFPGALMAVTLLLVRPPAKDSLRIHPLYLGAGLAVFFGLGVQHVLTAPVPYPPEPVDSLRVMTYNIQQGYDTQGEKAYYGQLELVDWQGADILGLQETDTARIAHGNGDVVRYLADKLGMYAYYGPTSVTGTFGIALLSRYPIRDAHTFFMFSEGEQTAAIQAEVVVGKQVFTVLVTHLGNGGPLIQQQQVLERLSGQTNVIAMGDFNFNPSKEQYRQTVAQFSDAWEAAAAQNMPSADFAIDRRIDHIFLSPNLRVQRAEYLPRGISDHPALVVDLDISQ